MLASLAMLNETFSVTFKHREVEGVLSGCNQSKCQHIECYIFSEKERWNGPHLICQSKLKGGRKKVVSWHKLLLPAKKHLRLETIYFDYTTSCYEELQRQWWKLTKEEESRVVLMTFVIIFGSISSLLVSWKLVSN